MHGELSMISTSGRTRFVMAASLGKRCSRLSRSIEGTLEMTAPLLNSLPSSRRRPGPTFLSFLIKPSSFGNRDVGPGLRRDDGGGVAAVRASLAKPCLGWTRGFAAFAAMTVWIGLVLAGSFTPAHALEGSQSQGNLQPIPIAIPVFLGEDQQLAQNIANVISNDLGGSALFQPLDRASFLEQVRDVNASPNFNNWKAIRADALVVGGVTRGADGRLIAEFRLWDVASGRALTGQRLSTGQQYWRRLAHQIADQVYQKLTGEKGYFDTRVVYVDETGPKERRTKRLAIMDQDGWPQSVRLLSQGQELVLTPRFSPTSQEIAYMAYSKGGGPRVYTMNLETGQRELVGDWPAGSEVFAARFSPDGQRVVMSQEEGGATSIFEIDLRSKQMRRLTQGDPQRHSIDTAPSYAPDGRQIVFESDREGTQQLYVMNTDGSGVRRVSSGDGRYSTPVWSPRGDYIAFTKQTGGSFLIGVMHPDGTGERILTEGYHNEGPTWAPNGRVLMFFRESQGANGGPRIYSVDLTGYNEHVVQTPAYASDPAWSPLLN
jgi:TolB protein